ncbi:MAG: UvrD-helicase domain-containing protein [Candidatus Omnitrophica bacterium]|nr:UvrD-helicase domain-containing protein [Candidatus Omnitrophota bacterium]
MTDFDLLSDLNPAQREAVTWGNAPLLVLAGAGSGKTRILTRRMAYLIAQGQPTYQILGVTFTNKAAQEMKARVMRLVRAEVWVSTFHATCLKILRSDAAPLEIDRNFTVYDESDQLSLIKECIQALQMNEKQMHPKGVRERIQRAKDILMTPLQYAEKSPDLYEEAVAKIYGLYEEKLRRLKALDFGDLIMKAVALFDRFPHVLESWQDRFRHILIDEYQDTNHAQYRLVKLLSTQYRQITVVGDPDQSIYSWRGADIQNILSFEEDYPECGMIRMEQNYRSTASILDAANGLISHNKMRKPKVLWTEQKGGDKITIFQAEDEKEEAASIVSQIIRYRNSGRTLADQVVFYRVHAQSRILEDALLKAHLPYVIVGGTRFYDRKEIKDVIAYLRLLVNPEDDVSAKRIMNVPPRGIGKKAQTIIESLQAEKKISFMQALSSMFSTDLLAPRMKQSLGGLEVLIKNLRRDCKELSVQETLELVLERTRYLEALEAEKTVEAQARIENIEEFFTVIEEFEQEQEKLGAGGLQVFLESITLMTDIDSWKDGTNVLTLMTLHSAKGLEFPIVFMMGLEEGLFPNIKASSDIGPELEEERRLCYVGITRAREKLHLSYAARRRMYGAHYENLPSRFLNEIPNHLLTQVGTRLRWGNSIRREDGDVSVDFDGEEIALEDDSREIKRRILFD